MLIKETILALRGLWKIIVKHNPKREIYVAKV